MDVGLRVVGLDDTVVAGLRVVGLDDVIIVGLDVGFRVVGALVIDDFCPPPQMQQAIFAVSPA